MDGLEIRTAPYKSKQNGTVQANVIKKIDIKKPVLCEKCRINHRKQLVNFKGNV